MIMKCSLKDIFINILFFIIIIIIIISPSEGVEFPLFIPRGSVISDSMNLQQLRASINRLQDLDSFPVSSENQLHKIVKKQMTNCDYHKRKSKRSIAVLPERLKSFDAMEKGDGYTKSLKDKPENLQPEDSTRIYEICISKLAEMARNSGIRFYPQFKSVQNRAAVNPGEATINPQIKNEKPQVHKEDNQNEKDKIDEDITRDVLESCKVVLNEYPGENDNLLKDSSKTSEEDLNLQLISPEDKIKEYLSEDQLPQINFPLFEGVEETEEEKLTEKSKDRLFKSDDKEEEKEPKEDKDSGGDDTLVEQVHGKNLCDLTSWDRTFERGRFKTKEKLVQLRKKEADKLVRTNPNLRSNFRRFPDRNDYRYYYECETKPNGCLKFRHKRCPQGQFFSFKFLKCLKTDNKRSFKNKFTILKRQTSFDTFSGNSEPKNEWLDASEDKTTVVPSEFQSTTEPGLKIYHLREKRKFGETAEMAENVASESGSPREMSDEAPKMTTNPELPHDGISLKHRKHHAPRSYMIRIKKKEGKNQIAENENDEDDEDSEDYDEDEEVEDEEEEEEENDEEEASDDAAVKAESSAQGLRDLFKAAKTAVTNRARFEDPSPTMIIGVNKGTQNACKKEPDSETQNKKVLIDANIKVDSAIGSVLKSLMKNKRKESLSSLTGDEASLISDRGSQDQLDPELLRMYEHLMRNNPRVKRYFRANRYKKGK